MKIFARCLALSVVALSASFSAAQADDIFVDEFNDNTGGLPLGWTRAPGSDARPETSVIEGIENVTITDFRGGVGGGGAPTMIESPAFDVFPPSSTTTVLNVSISGTSSTGTSSPQAIFAFGGSSFSLRFNLSQSADTLSIAAVEGSQTATEIGGSPFAFSYDGGAVSFTVTFTSGTVRVTSALNSFDTGSLSLSGLAGGNLTGINDLGPLSRFILGAEAAGEDGTATVQYDLVSYSTDAAYTPPVNVVTPDNSALRASLVAQVKKLQKQLKTAKRAGKTSKLKKINGKIKTLKIQLAGL